MPTIEADVRGFVTDNFLFGRKNVSLDGDDSLLEQGLIDSTGVLELVWFIENKFEIKVEDDDLVPDTVPRDVRIASLCAAPRSRPTLICRSFERSALCRRSSVKRVSVAKLRSRAAD